MKIGEVEDTLLRDRRICVICDIDEVAARLEHDGPEIKAFVKRKGRREVVSNFSCDMVQEVICELSSRIVSREEYDKY